MASSDSVASLPQLTNDFLTCTICYEVYTNPKCLPCLHTFCLECLSSYIVAEDDNYGVRRKQQFPCPVCRAITKPPVPSKPLSQWAKDFKNNFFLEDLMGTLMVKSKSSETLCTGKTLGTKSLMRLKSLSCGELSNEQTGTTAQSSNDTAQSSNDTTQSSDDTAQSSNDTAQSSNDTAQSSNDTAQSSNYTTQSSNDTAQSSNYTAQSSDDASMATIMTSVMRSLREVEGLFIISNLPSPGRRAQYKLSKSLSASVPYDKNVVRLTDICVMGDIIITLDYENCRVKSFQNWNHPECNNVTRWLDLPSNPIAITKVSDTKAAVTLLDIKEIFIIKVRGRLKVRYKVKTPNCYKAVVNSGKNVLIAVANREGRASPLEVFNYRDSTSVQIELSDELKREEFTHIALSNSGFIHLVDPGHKRIHCVTQEGQEVYRYEQENAPFKFISGLCCHGEGDFFLTEFESDSVYEVRCDSSLPETRDRIITADHGLVQPMGVAVDPNGNIFVACWDGVVRVYSVVRYRETMI